jgi:hypothetical protein
MHGTSTPWRFSRIKSNWTCFGEHIYHEFKFYKINDWSPTRCCWSSWNYILYFSKYGIVPQQ